MFWVEATFNYCKLRRLLRVGAVPLALALFGAPFSLPLFAAANTTVIIRDDSGGGVIERALLIQNYQTRGVRVEIRGEFCMSACTMYLRLNDICITPRTLFGFHGPSSVFHGVALDADSFERWSQVMADHYPEPIRSWFLDTGRFRTVGFHEFSGRQLIAMGIAKCTG